MGSAEEGIGIGAKLIITVLVASLGLAAFFSCKATNKRKISNFRYIHNKDK